MAKPLLASEQIRQLIPHRYPMLLVDRVLEISEQDVVAEKLISVSDPFLQGHFPDRPVMPGVLILDAIAQTAGIGVVWNDPSRRGRGVALLGINRARFHRPAVPGDILRLSTHMGHTRRDVLRIEGTASVQGELIAEAQRLIAFVDWEKLT